MAAHELLDSYSYLNAKNTYTLDQFKACDSEDEMCHINTSFLERIGHIKQSIYNIVDDYLDDLINDFSVKVELSDAELARYKYKPKLLCYDIYGSQEVYFILLLLNDMYSVKQFNKKNLKMITRADMKEICDAILNNNDEAIKKYNSNSLAE